MTETARLLDAGGEVEISVVTPVYGAQMCLEELYRRLRSSLEPLTRRFEILMVEDGGPDDSWRVIRQLAEADPRVRGLQLSRNFGQHHAITAGLEASRGRWIVVMDCDLQDRPEEIPRLYAKALEGYDCVLARRALRRDGRLKRLGSQAFYRLFNYLTDLHYDASVANFSIISRRVANELRRLGEAVRFYPALLAWIGFSKAFIDVQHDPRFKGETSYTFRKLLRLSSHVILAHSNKPIRLSIKAGFALSALAFLAGLAYALKALVYGTPVLGWPTLIISICFSTGAIISMLGILGLYIDRIYSEVKGRPVFIVKERTDDR